MPPADMLQPDPPAASSQGAPHPLVWLEQTDSIARRRLLIVLLVSLPLWAYATTWDILVMLFQSASEQKGVGIAEILQRIAIRLPLLPLLVGALWLAANVVWRRGRTLRFAVDQIAVALLFSVLTRPLLVISYYAVQHAAGQPLALTKLFHDYMPWRYWAATAVQYTIVYLLGLVLIYGVNLFLRFRSEQLKAEQLRSKYLESRLSALRGQINPHFFFNALNIIVALIRSDPDRAEKVVTELGALLRRTLTNGNHEFAAVREELAFIERYLGIIKTRFEDRLDVSMQFERDTLHYRLPTFLLVPLVENAIKHGVAKTPGHNHVVIRGYLRDGRLVCTIANRTGDGIDRSGADGLGLDATRRRLSAIYGSRYHFEAGPAADGSWITKLSLPAELHAGAAPAAAGRPDTDSLEIANGERLGL